MKKTIILSILMLLVILLTACGTANGSFETSENTQAIEETTLPLVKILNSSEYVVWEVMSMDDEHAYSSPKFVKNKDVEPKTVKIFETDLTLYYTNTKTYVNRSYCIDLYDATDSEEGLYIFAEYRADTNQLVKYSQVSAKNLNYVSAVNPASTESEYIAYAKKIILDNTGFSLDGWKVRIESYSDSHGIEDKFVNYEKASLTTTYTFTFYKTIDGIERCDKTVITMTNMGEIISFEVMPNDEAFAPYLDVEIDSDKVKEAVFKAFDKKRNRSKYKKVEIVRGQLVTAKDGLWVEVGLVYELNTGEQWGLAYIMKIAEIEKLASENEVQ